MLIVGWNYFKATRSPTMHKNNMSDMTETSHSYVLLCLHKCLTGVEAASAEAVGAVLLFACGGAAGG